MSAFIVSDGVINRIVNLLASDEYEPDKILSYHIRHLGYSPSGNPKLLARHMHNLNRFVIWKLYKEKPAYTHHYSGDWETNRYQVLKDLKCFLYQCSEDGIEQTRLFKALRQTEIALMNVLLREIPAFQRTVWDLE